MKTLADFKRDIQVGNSILYIERLESPRMDLPLEKIEVPERLRMMRLVTYKDSTGFYLKDIRTRDKSKGSFCGYPKAGELEYDGESFTITEKDHNGKIWQVRKYKIFTN